MKNNNRYIQTNLLRLDYQLFNYRDFLIYDYLCLFSKSIDLSQNKSLLIRYLGYVE